MKTESDSTHHRALLLIPLGGYLAVICSVVAMMMIGDDFARWSYVVAGLGGGLGVAYFILSIVRFHARSSRRLEWSLILSLILIAFSGFVIFAEHAIANFSIFGPPRPPSLAESLQNAATTAAAPAAAYLKTGKSGPLIGTNWTDSHWTNPKGGEIPLAISWTRNPRGILVAALPDGPIPEGQDGTVRTQQVLNNGMLEFPLDYYEKQGKNSQASTWDLFSPEYFMFNDLIHASATPIIDYAKSHEGKLPTQAEGDRLLKDVKKVFEFNPDSGSKPSDQAEIRFEITQYTYRPTTDGMFLIDYAWEWIAPGRKSDDKHDLKAVGTLSIHYTARGTIAIRSGDDYFDRLLQSVGRQGSEEERRERETEKKAPTESKGRGKAGNNTGDQHD